jgi:hypothetical protein
VQLALPHLTASLGSPSSEFKHSVQSIGRTPIISESFIGGGVGAGGGELKELGDDTKVLTHPKPIIGIEQL